MESSVMTNFSLWSPTRAGSRRSRPAAAFAMAVVSVAALSACGADDEPAAGPLPATKFTKNGVTVDLRVAEWKAPNGTLEVTFTPTDEGFHLYSADLPADGVEGVGRPTVVALSGAITAAGEPTASSSVSNIRVPGVKSTVPVYPDGPVTLTVPVHTDGTGNAAALLTYASCSTAEGCTVPVEKHPVALHVTDAEVAFSGH
ncbi:hypothetical protein [Streptomyces sp. NPDC126514]|uniref:hypothetical protein n=1 Tax=Streptomyces sp. NPDC126514 TaxID=3155210 RepID=UPI003318F486